MLRITFFAVASLICSTQAYAVMYLARPYEPNMARWLTRDPIGEDGGPNLYGFLGNNPLGDVDVLGLCGCKCKSLLITFIPGGNKFDPGFYEIGGDSRFGIVITAAWTVEGDPAECKYFAKEPDGGLTKIKGPRGSKPDTTGTPGGDWAPVPQVWHDATGFDMEGPGDYQIKYRLTQTYKCVSADGTEMVVGPKHYRKTVKKKWPQK